MPQIISCPDCGRKLRVPDHLVGKKVKCPGCGVNFVGETEEGPEELDEMEAPSPPPPSRSRPPREERVVEKSSKTRRPVDEEEEDDDRPSPRRRDRDEDDDDDDYGRQRSEPSKGDVRQGWERVRFGINLVITAAWISLAAVGVAISGYLVLILFVGASVSTMISSTPTTGPMNQHQAGQMAGQAAGTMAGAMIGGCVMIALVGLLFLAVVATRLTGLGFCMGVVPTRKTQSLKGLAIAAFSLGIANVILPLLSNGATAALGRNNGVVAVAGQGFFFVLAIAEVICFFLFLRGVAVAMRKEGLARNLVMYLIGLAVFAFLIVPIGFVLLLLGVGAAAFGVASSHNGQAAAANAANAMAGFAILGISCFILLILIGVGFFVWYMVLLYQTRSAVDGWLARN
jgi:hypothetical protein